MVQTKDTLAALGRSLASILEAGIADGITPGEKVIGTLYIPVSPRLQEAVGALAFHPLLNYGGSPQALARHAIVAWCYALTQAVGATNDESLRELRRTLHWDIKMTQIAKRRKREENYSELLAAIGANIRSLIAGGRATEVDGLVTEARLLAAEAPTILKATLERRCANDQTIQYAVEWLADMGVNVDTHRHWIDARVS